MRIGNLGSSARADVEDGGEALAGNGVEHFLHQHEALAGSEVRHAPAGERVAFASRGRRVLGLGLDERDDIAPEVPLAVGDFGLIPGPHRGRGGDRVSARAVGDVGLGPDHAARSVRRGGNPRVGKLFFVVAHISAEKFAGVAEMFFLLADLEGAFRSLAAQVKNRVPETARRKHFVLAGSDGGSVRCGTLETAGNNRLT